MRNYKIKITIVDNRWGTDEYEVITIHKKMNFKLKNAIRFYQTILERLNRGAYDVSLGISYKGKDIANVWAVNDINNVFIDIYKKSCHYHGTRYLANAEGKIIR